MFCQEETSYCFLESWCDSRSGVRKAPYRMRFHWLKMYWYMIENRQNNNVPRFQNSGESYFKINEGCFKEKIEVKKENVSGVQLVAFYNGMLAVDERKQVIQAIKKSDVHMVITTNALEVGIDIGDLSFAILSGFLEVKLFSAADWPCGKKR